MRLEAQSMLWSDQRVWSASRYIMIDRTHNGVLSFFFLAQGLIGCRQIENFWRGVWFMVLESKWIRTWIWMTISLQSVWFIIGIEIRIKMNIWIVRRELGLDFWRIKSDSRREDIQNVCVCNVIIMIPKTKHRFHPDRHNFNPSDFKMGVLNQILPLLSAGGSRPPRIFTCSEGCSRRGAPRLESRVFLHFVKSASAVPIVTFLFWSRCSSTVALQVWSRPAG